MRYLILTSAAAANTRNAKVVPSVNGRANYKFLSQVPTGGMAIIKVGKISTVDNIRRAVQRAAKPLGLTAKAVDNHILVW